MSRFFALLALVCLTILFTVNSEVIVSDNLGNVVGLPLSGGNDTGGFTVANPPITTSPYVLTIFINDQIEPGQSVATRETYQLAPGAPLYGNATLTSFVFNGATQALSTANNLFTTVGSYVYTFTIPVGSVANINITYNSTLPADVDKIFISIANPVFIRGDPQFFGLRGQSYQVHGVDGVVYNLITEANTQVNSRFVFLNEGVCPMFNGVPDTNCWSHPGSYLGEMSFQQVVDGKLHAAMITAGTAEQGFAAVQMDGKLVKLGAAASFGDFSITHTSSHKVVVSMENFDFELSNSDLFINQAVRAKTPISQLTSHGLLGQTHANKVYSTSVRYIEGQVDDYAIGDNDLFGNDFIFNKFQQ